MIERTGKGGNVLLVKIKPQRKSGNFRWTSRTRENLEQAVTREVKEESGVDVEVKSLAVIYSSIKQNYLVRWCY